VNLKSSQKQSIKKCATERKKKKKEKLKKWKNVQDANHNFLKKKW